MFQKSGSIHSNARQIMQLVFSNDGNWLASAQIQPNGVSIFDCKTYKLITLISDFNKGVSSIAVNPNNSLLATGSLDGTIKLWKTDNWELLRVLPIKHEKGINGLTFDSTGNIIISANFLEREIIVWDLETDNIKQRIKQASLQIESSIDLTRNTVAITDSGVITFFDLTTGEIVHSFNDNVDISPISISSDGKWMACITKDEKVNLWNLSEYNLKSTFSLYPSGASFPFFDPQGEILAAIHMYSSCITLWAISTNKKLQVICNNEFYQAKSICFNNNSILLACGFENDFSTNSLIEIWKRHS